MSSINIWVSDGTQDEVKRTLTEVAEQLDLKGVKGATPSTFIGWLAQQPVEDIVEALKPLRAESLRRRATKFDV